ncbi:MAG: serine/threonine protein kinase [Deltaproteobacteria bacterium]|nr:serine/threonine protein kinase [Deltaproteobacteria bacterium]
MLGAAVGNYRIDAKLGEGGMGVVYLAEHTMIGRKAAIKVLLPEFSHSQEVVNRFFNEARSTAMIKHPGLVDIFDFGYLPDGSAYIVMEFLEGESLSARLRRERQLPLAVLCAITRGVAIAVGAAHHAGIVHRDLKPDNIFLVPDPEQAFGVRVKVLDFGIAKLASSGPMGPTSKTRTGAVMGTPMYMSPEQCRGAGQVDHRCDIYSLGCIMYEMACGRTPFVKEGVGEIIAAQIYEQPQPLRAVDPTLSPGLDAVVMRALAKQLEARQQSMEQLRAEIDQLVTGVEWSGPVPRLPMPAGGSGPLPLPPATSGPVPRALPTPGPSVPSSPSVMTIPRRSRGLFVGVLAGALVVIVVAVVLIVLQPWRSSIPQEPPAPVPPAPPVLAAPASAPAPGPAAAPAPAVAAKVKLKVESDPPGAEVYRAADGVLVGRTPATVEMTATSGLAVFVVKRAGYQDGRAELPADKDGATLVKLNRAPAGRPAARPAAKPPEPAKVVDPGTKPPPTRKPVRDGVVDPFGQ